MDSRRGEWIFAVILVACVGGGQQATSPDEVDPSAPNAASSPGLTESAVPSEPPASESALPEATAVTGSPTATTDGAPEPTRPSVSPQGTPPQPRANAISVFATGSEGSYTFNVTVKSPDTGCEQYADWWEVLTPEGALIYRRVLGHSHVDEQPFTRSGGPVAVDSQDEVIVRAHMNTTGYGGAVQRGAVGAGFALDPSVDDAFAAEVASEPPQPDDCAF